MRANRTYALTALTTAGFLALAVAAPAPLIAHDAQHFSAGKPGNPRQPFRTVEVKMHDGPGTMSFAPARLEIKRGEQVKFVISNVGALAHEFVLASTEDNLKHAELMRKYPDMEHDDPNGKTVQPSAKTEILWRFIKAGTFEFACLIPGHREAGMTGTIVVK